MLASQSLQALQIRQDLSLSGRASSELEMLSSHLQGQWFDHLLTSGVFYPSLFDRRETRGSGFPGGSAGKEFPCNGGDLGLIPGLGRSPGESKDYPLQYSGLENAMDCIAHEVAKSQT